MHIGVNLVFLTPGEQGGLEVYARQLVPRLARKADLSLTAFVNRDTVGVFRDHDIREVIVPVRPADRKQWVIGEQVILPKLARAEGCDLVHSLASTAPLWGSFKRVTTIHDLNYRIVPEAHSPLFRLGMKVLVEGAARRSHRIIADSACTARDLAEHLRVPTIKTDVVPLGVDHQEDTRPTSNDTLRRRLNLGDNPVILSVSAKRPYKNLERLLRAHAMLPPPRPVLVLPGYSTNHELELRGLAVQLGIDESVRFLGWVTPEDLEGLYRLALLFVFPSLYEGFGLPPLEAMARGLPVITSHRGALAEVVGDAAVVVNPESVEEIRDSLIWLLGNGRERERLRNAGMSQAAQFKWDVTADLTAETYYRATELGCIGRRSVTNG